MNLILNFVYVVVILLILSSCNEQVKSKDYKPKELNKMVGGKFENREFTYYDIPKIISSTDTSAGWNQKGQKLLLTGTIYQIDAKKPAPDVLLYYYHTNMDGKYLHKTEEPRSMPPNELGQTHGYIRGWVKSDSLGRYFIYTVRPGVYPTRDAPAHIHITIKEPNDINEYYIDDFVFDDDKLTNNEYRSKMENRCGSGVLRLVTKENLFVGERNIILGLNIPNYPLKSDNNLNSGKNIGEDVVSFIPYHAWGPDIGKRTCPVCKYGWYHGILYFVGNNPKWIEIKQWLRFLEQESIIRDKYLKVYFVYGNEKAYSKKAREKELKKIGSELQLERLALCFVPSFSDSESEINLNKVDQRVENTFIVYKRSKIVDKFVNLKPVEKNFKLIRERLDETVNEYFDLPKAQQE